MSSFAGVPVGFIFPRNTEQHMFNKMLQHEFNKVLQRLAQSGLLARAIKRQSGVVDLVQVARHQS